MGERGILFSRRQRWGSRGEEELRLLSEDTCCKLIEEINAFYRNYFLFVSLLNKDFHIKKVYHGYQRFLVKMVGKLQSQWTSLAAPVVVRQSYSCASPCARSQGWVSLYTSGGPVRDWLARPVHGHGGSPP